MLVPSIFENNFVDDMFDNMFDIPFGFSKTGTKAAVSSMNTDVQEFDDRYQLDLELPGYQKEEIQAELKDGYLTINAEHSETKEDKDQEDGKYIRKERFYGKCKRSFYVGDQITQEDIKAKFENGVLQVVIPKIEAKEEIPERKYIAIEG